MTALFRTASKNTRQHTSFAYEIGFFPWEKLLPAQKKLIFWRKAQKLEKGLLERRLGEDLNEYYFVDDPLPFKIQWMYGKVPTEQEWNAVGSRTTILVDLRISPCLEYGGRVAIFELSPYAARPKEQQ